MGVKVDPVPPSSAPLDGHRRRGREYGRVLVLNATFEPINVCTVRRAAVLLLKDKAEVVEHAELGAALREPDAAAPGGHPPRDLRAGAARHPPAQDHPPRRLRPRPLDLPVLRLAREPDGGPRRPAVQGRRSSWDNIVTSCAPCNRRKGDRLLRHVGMKLRPRAAQPQPPDLHPRRQPRPSPRRGGRICPKRRRASASRTAGIEGGPERATRVRPRDISPAWRQSTPGSTACCPERFEGAVPRCRCCGRHAPSLPDTTRGARGRPSRTSDWTGLSRVRCRRGDQLRLRSQAVSRVGFAKRIQPSDLAAGHLQGPEQTVTQRRTTSFPWSAH